MRTKYEIPVHHVDTNGDKTPLPLTIDVEEGSLPHAAMQIGRGTEVLVDIEELAAVLHRIGATA